MTLTSRYRQYRESHQGLAAFPVRIVHLGVGAFHRAHQAWYTHRANQGSGPGWGIAAFTGRSPRAAEALAAQNGLYHLLTRGAHSDEEEVIGSLTEVHDGADAVVWRAAVASDETRIVSLTITEKGYRRAGDSLDTNDPEIRADLDLLRRWSPSSPLPVTAPARLVDGLMARRASGAGALAILSCDNLPANGAATRAVVREVAALIDPSLVGWIDDRVRFPSSVVDRITPAAHGARASFGDGLDDAAVVVTEPHTEWVLQDDFPGGRPEWDQVGARFVDDVAPFEQRKLWMLNGAHTLLAVVGRARGLTTVSEAISDAPCARLVEQLWDDAAAFIELPEDELADYRLALRTRFANPRIEHRLSQIASDSETKIGLRIMPVLERCRAAGRAPGAAAVDVIATWMLASASSDVVATLQKLGGASIAHDSALVDAVGDRLTSLRAGGSRVPNTPGGRP